MAVVRALAGLLALNGSRFALAMAGASTAAIALAGVASAPSPARATAGTAP